MVVSLTGETDAAAGFIYLLRPRCHRKPFRFAARFPMPTTPEQPDFARCKFLVFCCLQHTKSGVHIVNSAVHAAAEKCLSSVGQPLSSSHHATSWRRKRYNTLDFLSWLKAKSCKSRVPTGMLLAPIGNPEPRDASRLPARSVFQNASHFEVSTGDPPPSGHPHIFLENGTQTVKMQFGTIPQKIQNRCNLHPCRDENCNGFLRVPHSYSYARMCPAFSFHLLHPIAHANVGLDILRRAGCCLQLFSQCCHKHTKGTNIIFPTASPHIL